QVQEFVRAVTEEMHEPVSLFLRIQQAIPGKETQFYEIHLAGQSYIEEKMQIFVEKMQRSLLFAISPTAFFQPNSRQSERLYTRALEMVGFVPRKRIMDLYAGTATLGILFAPMAEKVLSIEINPYAVFDAERNRELNDSDHVEIMKGDVAEVLQECLRKDPSWKEVDLVLLDPPRTGLMPKALGILMQIAPKEILYISCSPLTQARDCLLLQKEGYQIIAVQPVDQFPHTVHIENIVYLQRG
ncbi:MAG: class I SAM-dependent RNA methyltransferase, partial [Chlamydiae bacterium]|nr:class I SAM-dependent RNA methyltransferase [Chlamydiota bacterium]